MGNILLPTNPITIIVKNNSQYDLGLPPPIDAVIPRGGSYTTTLTDKTQLNQDTIANSVNSGQISITVVDVNAEPGEEDLRLDQIIRGDLTYCDHFLLLQADATVVYTQTGASSAITIPSSQPFTNQIDQPRTVRVVTTGSAAGTVIIQGIQSTGVGNSESIVATSAAASFEGGVPWAIIQNITFPALTGGQSMAVQFSSKLGLVGLIADSSSVFKVTKGNGSTAGADFPFLSTAIVASNGTFNTGGIAANDNYTIRYRT